LANQHDLRRSAESGCLAVMQCADKGLTDTDVTQATIKALIAAVVARRDAVTTKSGQRTAFDLLIQAIQEAANYGVLTDAIVNAFTTVAASPFVAGVATDFLSTMATNLSSTIGDPFTLKRGGMLAPFPSFSYQGAQ
jgi:hypothetical protein